MWFAILEFTDVKVPLERGYGAYAIRPSGLVVGAWTLRQGKTLPRISQKNGKGHQNGYGQMPHRSILTGCGGIGKDWGVLF